MMGSFIASDSQAMTGLLASPLVLPMPNCRAHTMEGGLCNSAPIPGAILDWRPHWATDSFDSVSSDTRPGRARLLLFGCGTGGDADDRAR